MDRGRVIITLSLLSVFLLWYFERKKQVEGQQVILQANSPSASTLPSQAWKKPDRETLKKTLTPEQFSCTQENGTERPFANKYWNHKEDGLYVDVVSGEPLFSSLTKFDSGSGWPSFSAPINGKAIRTLQDSSHGMNRIEVRSSRADSHLGHVFNDGPGPTKTRYCINSASLRFVPLLALKQEGLGMFMFDFAKQLKLKTATLAGGCFWGLEKLLSEVPGVVETRVGYSGGTNLGVTYDDVKLGLTGHAESVQILYDPKRISFEKILLAFFRFHDPTTINRQGNDIGTQYRSAIFFETSEEKRIAEDVISRVDASKKWSGKVVTRLEATKGFVIAEDEHQKYLVRNPKGYTCHFDRKFNF